MIIPIKILIAAILTLAAILGKLSEQLGVIPTKDYITAEKAILSAVLGAAVFFWILCIFGGVSFISVFSGIIVSVFCALLSVGELNFKPRENTSTDNLSEKFLLEGKKGVITDVVNDAILKNSNNVYIGKLFETEENIVVHIDGKANVGNEFEITHMNNAEIFAKII